MKAMAKASDPSPSPRKNLQILAEGESLEGLG